MEWNWKQYHKQKHQFRSYYCAGCKQQKPCQLLTGWDSKWQSYCCWCYFQNEQEKAREYGNYEKVLTNKHREKKEHDKQLQLLKNYQGCSECGSKEADAYSLYENNRLVCQPCLMKKAGSSSSPISFSEQQKWYRKFWKIDLGEWLESYGYLPVNANCAREWMKDKEHLKSCKCLEKEVKELVELFTGSLREMEEKLKDCRCEKSEKVRVSSDYYTTCEKCEGIISVASKKRVIKNRNNPSFWGLEVREKTLCLNCLKKFQKRMPKRKQYLLTEYLKRESKVAVN